MFSFGIANAMTKTITEKIGVNQYMFFRGLVVASMIFVLFLINTQLKIFSYNVNSLMIVAAFGVAVLGYLALSLLYRSFNLTKVSIASPISSFNVVIAILLSSLFLGLKLNTFQLVAITIIIISVLLIRFNPKDLKSIGSPEDIKGINLALLSTLFMGIYFFFIQIPTKILGPLLTPISTESQGYIVAYSVMKYKKEQFKFPNKRSLGQAFLATMLIVIASVALYFGLQEGNAGIMLALYSSSPIISAIYGGIVYKEKLVSRQYFAIALLIAGVIALRIYS